MKTREQIEDKYKWDLTHLFACDKDALDVIEECKVDINKLPAFKGKLGNINKLHEYLTLGTSIGKRLDVAVIYFNFKLSENVASTTYNKILGDIENLSRTISLNTAFENSELLSYGDEYLREVLNNKKFKNYKMHMEELIRLRPHVLNEESNKLMAKINHFAGDFGEVFDKFDAVDVKFDDVFDKNGKKHKLNTANYSNYIESKDRVLRKNAFNSLYKSFVAMSNTIGVNYIAHVKADEAYADIYNYPSALDAELFDDNISVDVYNRLVDEVNAHLPLLHNYYKLKKKVLGLKDFTYYDSYVDIANVKGFYPFDKAVEMTLQAVKPMGESYVNLVKQEIAERWVDVYPTEGKTTGGYENACYGKHPYILLNNTGTLDDCFTFAHETGHAMHSYFSNLNQPYETAAYPIVLAEVASTTNEVLLLKYLYGKAKTKQEKIYYLDKYLKMFKSTIFRQTMFSQFEAWAHDVVNKGGTLTVEALCNYYGELNKKYHGSAIKHDNNINYEWLRIPHFYRSYYVYKYATGLTSAICIASNILNNVPNALENYYRYLSSGGSRYPLDTLKLAGVDLTTSKPYEVAFGEMEWALKELSKLV